MKTFEKLKIKIKKDLNIDVHTFTRTYAGIHMRASGAFVWDCIIGRSKLIGSTITATELLKKDKLQFLEASGRHEMREII